MYSGRSLSRSNAAADRLGGSIGQVEFGSVGPLRPALSVAIPSFHGDRMDVPRGLRSRRLLRVAARSGEGAVCKSTNRTAAPGSPPLEYPARLGTAVKHSLPRGSVAPQRGIPVLWVAIRASQIQCSCASTPFGLDHLSSITLRLCDCHSWARLGSWPPRSHRLNIKSRMSRAETTPSLPSLHFADPGRDCCQDLHGPS